MGDRIMTKRALALVLAALMALMGPVQSFAQGYLGINVQLAEGINEHEVTAEKALSEEEMDALLNELSSEYMTDISADEAAFMQAAADARTEDSFGDINAAVNICEDGESLSPMLFSLFSAANDPVVHGDDELTEIPEGIFRLYPVTDNENGNIYSKVS